MFQGWRFKLREAKEAFRQGRLDEARCLIFAGGLVQYLPGKRLAGNVAAALTQRAMRLAAGGDTTAAWRELEAAQSLGGDSGSLLTARQQLVAWHLRELENYLIADDPAGALARIESLEKKQIAGDALRSFKEVARRMDSARKLCLRGRFADAQSQLDSALSIRPDLAVVRHRHEKCRQDQVRCRELTEQLHRAMSNDEWSGVLSAADQLLELAPDFALAHDARRRAWEKVDTRLDDVRLHAADPLARRKGPLRNDAASAGLHDETSAGSSIVADAPSAQRFLLWVDAVGGFLTCLGNEVMIGQAVPESPVEIAIQGDLSRRHARIRREGEGYVIEPLAAANSGGLSVNGKPISSMVLLGDGDEITLSDSVRLRFRQPHALSATARLDWITRHRTEPWCDSILLMAESCVLGPGEHNHVVCRDWSHDVVLYRQGGQLYCRTMEPFEIDDRLVEGRGRLAPDSRVSGDDFTLSLEPI